MCCGVRSTSVHPVYEAWTVVDDCAVSAICVCELYLFWLCWLNGDWTGRYCIVGRGCLHLCCTVVAWCRDVLWCSAFTLISRTIHSLGNFRLWLLFLFTVWGENCGLRVYVCYTNAYYGVWILVSSFLEQHIPVVVHQTDFSRVTPGWNWSCYG